MSEVLPGIWNVTNKLHWLHTAKSFKWKPWGTRRGGWTGRALDCGYVIHGRTDIVHAEDGYAILKHHSCSYRSGQGYAAGMKYIPTQFELVKIDEGDIETTGVLTVLITLECGHKWRQGIQYLKDEIAKLKA